MAYDLAELGNVIIRIHELSHEYRGRKCARSFATYLHLSIAGIFAYKPEKLPQLFGGDHSTVLSVKMFEGVLVNYNHFPWNLTSHTERCKLNLVSIMVMNKYDIEVPYMPLIGILGIGFEHLTPPSFSRPKNLH